MMTRRSLSLAAISVAITILLLHATPSLAQAPSAEQKQATVRYLLSLQNPDGGFGAAPGQPSSVSATSSALRGIRLWGGAKDKDPAKFEQFVLKRQKSGGIADTSDTPPAVRSTAQGLLVLAEVRKLPLTKVDSHVRYLTTNAKALPDIYLADAALDEGWIKIPQAKEKEWVAAFQSLAKPDGSYGSNAVETAQAVLVQLNRGVVLRNRLDTYKYLLAAQKPDGGWGAGAASDLNGTYVVAQAITKLSERADSGKVLGFVARCRNADGAYGIAPGKPSGAAPTYFAGGVLEQAQKWGLGRQEERPTY